MVYYTGLPLLMQQTENGTTQVCFNNIQNGDRDPSITAPTTATVPNGSRTFHQIVNLSNNNQQKDQLLTAQPNNAYNHNNSSNYQNISAPSSNVQQINNIQQQPPPTINSKYKCEQCNMSLGSKSAHTSHMKTHAKQYQTSSVNSSKLPTMVSGNNSNSSTTGPALSSSDPYQCDQCQKTFAVPARLVRHYRTHTGERPFECEFCHKMFSVKENLQVHRRIHTKERPYKCDVCGRAFEHSGKLHRHMRIHTGERPHKCSVCGKTFIQSGQLVIHMRTHTGEKPYKCPVEGCGKGFTCSKQLKVHSRTHTGEKPYRCDICFRDFGYNHVLKLHRVQHYGSKCYKCTICEETFKSKKEMEAHIKGHANEMPEDEENDSKSNLSSSINTGSNMDLSPSSSILNSDNMILNMDIEDVQHNGVDLKIKNPAIEQNNENGDNLTYYNMYSRFEQSVVSNYGVQSGVNPALLAAASIAAAATVASHEERSMNSITLSPQSNNSSSSLSSSPSSSSSMMQRVTTPPLDVSAQNQAFMYEPLAIMRQHGYFAPASQVSEFRSTLDSANDIVRRVEAAIAGAETLLTPPRSSPESPDRSSSPESDSVLMADRDNNTLPPRKRKLYFKDNQNGHSMSSSSANDVSPVMRMSSVIQYAKAS